VVVQVLLQNVKFVQNSARLGGGLLVTNGGGVYLSQGIDASRNCLFLENEALDGGGCCFLAAGHVSVHRDLLTMILIYRYKSWTSCGV